MAERLVRQPAEVERLRLARSLGVSYKRLHGWEPRTFQYGLSRSGDRVPISQAWEIVTEVEPEWDDRQRTLVLALGRFEAGICECGQHEQVATDPDNFFTFEEKVCPVCKAWARFGRVQADRDDVATKRMGENPDPNAPHPADGRHTYLRPMSQDEVERRRRASRSARTSS